MVRSGAAVEAISLADLEELLLGRAGDARATVSGV